MQLRKSVPYGRTGFLCLVIVLLYGSLQAQDPSFSQFYVNRSYLNPAFTGLENGVVLNGVSRMQWRNIDGGFNTSYASVETRLPVFGIGIGLNVLRDEAGIANLTNNQIGMTFSYTIPGKKSNFHFGIEGKWVQKSVDWNKFVFTDQLDPWDGIVQESALDPVLDRVSYGDLNFGFVWRNETDIKIGKQKFSNVRSHLGVSFNHLPYLINKNLQGFDSFLNQEFSVAPRTTIHGGMIIPIKFLEGATGKKVAFSPNFKLDSQGESFLNFKENMTVGTVGMYTLVDNFYVGLLYQNRVFLPSNIHTDSYIFSLGGYANNPFSRNPSEQPNLFLGLSFDLHTTGVGPLAGNTLEFNIRYRFLENANFGFKTRGKRRSKNVLDCKSFF